MSLNREEAEVDLDSLLRKAKKDSSWEAVQIKLQELLSMPQNEEYFEEFDFVVPPSILESLILVIRLSTQHDEDFFPPILQRICSRFENFTFEHVRVAYKGSTEREVLELDVYGEGKRHERNESTLMLLLCPFEPPLLDRLKSAHFLATKCTALLHVASSGQRAGENFHGTVHPMKIFPKLVEQVLENTKDDEVALQYIRNYWFPVHTTWCNEIGVADNTGDRFIRMLFDLIVAETDELLAFICMKKMWDIPAWATSKVWKGILKSGCLAESATIQEYVFPILEVTPDCVVFAQEMNRSTNVIYTLIKNNPGAFINIVVDGEKPKAKRYKTDHTC